MISGDVKAKVKQQEINYQVTVLYKFLQEVPSKLEIQCKKGMYFHLILVGFPSILTLNLCGPFSRIKIYHIILKKDLFLAYQKLIHFTMVQMLFIFVVLSYAIIFLLL